MSRTMSSIARLFFVGALVHVVVAVDHRVGGGFGWNFPPSLTFYSEWARNNTFFVGDTLRFIPYPNQTHSHAEAQSQEEFDGCVEQGLVYDSTVHVTLGDHRLGPRYFICTDGNHCNIGMKFTIHVLPKPVTSTPNTAVKFVVFSKLLFFTFVANLFLFV